MHTFMYVSTPASFSRFESFYSRSSYTPPARRQHLASLVLPLEISSLEPADGLHLSSFRIGHPLEIAGLGGAAIVLGVVGYILVSLLVHIFFTIERRLSLPIEGRPVTKPTGGGIIDKGIELLEEVANGTEDASLLLLVALVVCGHFQHFWRKPR